MILVKNHLTTKYRMINSQENNIKAKIKNNHKRIIQKSNQNKKLKVKNSIIKVWKNNFKAKIKNNHKRIKQKLKYKKKLPDIKK